jgi:hypothetical protein
MYRRTQRWFQENNQTFVGAHRDALATVGGSRTDPTPPAFPVLFTFWASQIGVHVALMTGQFTTEELALNSSGKLSSGQKQRLQRLIRRQHAVNIIGIILADAFLVGATLYVWFTQLRDMELEQSTRDLQVYAFIGTQVIVAFGFFYQLVIKPRIAKWGMLQSVRGTARVDVIVQETVIYHTVTISGKRLFVPANIAEQFTNGGRYTVYFSDTPQGIHILSWREGS